MCTGTRRSCGVNETSKFIILPSRRTVTAALSPTYLRETKYEKLMRSPVLKTTVPSEATSTPSNFINTSPRFNTLAAGARGDRRRSKTPLCAGFILRLLRSDGFSKRWNSHCSAGKPLYTPVLLKSLIKWSTTGVGMM